MFIAAPEKIAYKLLPSTFLPAFTAEEEALIAGEFSHPWNGRIVCLEHLAREGSTLMLGLAPSRYFDLLSSNLLVNRDISDWTAETQTLAKHFRQTVSAEKLAEDSAQIFSCAHLANDLPVSVLLHDREGRCLLAERSLRCCGPGPEDVLRLRDRRARRARPQGKRSRPFLHEPGMHRGAQHHASRRVLPALWHLHRRAHAPAHRPAFGSAPLLRRHHGKFRNKALHLYPCRRAFPLCAASHERGRILPAWPL